MNVVGPILDAIAVALAVLLAFIGFGAALRYRDLRFALVGMALSILGLVGAVGAADLLRPGTIPDGDLGTVPIVLLIASEVLLYFSFVVARSPLPTPSSP
jgi:hypothetical protein